MTRKRLHKEADVEIEQERSESIEIKALATHTIKAIRRQRIKERNHPMYATYIQRGH